MRLLADEHISRRIIDGLQADGHDVLAVARHCPGASDLFNLSLAVTDTRVIVTYDSDYGELVFSDGVPAPPGVIYIRIDSALDDLVLARVREVLRFVAVEGHMTVVDAEAEVRLRKLPGR